MRQQQDLTVKSKILEFNNLLQLISYEETFENVTERLEVPSHGSFDS